MSIQALSDIFGDRNISTCIWPEHSPDLKPYDFFSCGSLKEKVYNSKTHMEELKKKKTIIGKLQIFLQNSFKGLMRNTSAGVWKVYIHADGIFNTFSDL
jgi:hypothetical protein